MPEASSTAGLAFERWGRSLIRRSRASEAALVRAAQKGSEEAVAELLARHGSSAYRAVFLVTGEAAGAEDIAEEAFLSALRALPSFDMRRPLRPWLQRIVVNRAIDWSRARVLRYMHIGWPAAAVAVAFMSLTACGSRGGEGPGARPSTPPSTRVATREQRFLRREPDLGVACAKANSIACDRVGLAIWLKRAAARVTATINGQALRLHAGGLGGRGPTYWEGYRQHAGLLAGPLKVTPDRGRYFWQGSHPKDARVAITIERPYGSTDEASLSVPLRAGWG